MTEQAIDWLTPQGNFVTIICREGTADAALVEGLLPGDEYGLARVDEMTGVMLDVGAHIGAISLAMLADFPGLHVVAIEPLPMNADLIRRSGANWLAQGRLTVIEAAAGATEGVSRIGYNYRSAAGADVAYVHDNRFIGGMWREGDADGDVIEVPTVTLRQLAEQYGVPGADDSTKGFVMVKVDCEGAEYAFLADGAELCGAIVGEWHDGGPDRIRALLEPTHRFEVREDHGGTGTFWAFRR